MYEKILKNTVAIILALLITLPSAILISPKSSAETLPIEETNVRQFLDEGKVLIISRGWYEELEHNEALSISGHATVIYGYIMVDNVCLFLMRDPGPETVGSTVSISYAKLVNGRSAGGYDNGADTGIWRGSVTFNTSYANNTVPWYFG